MEKGQSSADFLIVSTVILTIFLMFFSIYAEKEFAVMEMRERFAAKRIAEKVARGINEVIQAGDGAQLTVDVEQVRGGRLVRVVSRRVEVTYPLTPENKSVSVPVLSNFSIFETNATSISITNSNGTVALG